MSGSNVLFLRQFLRMLRKVRSLALCLSALVATVALALWVLSYVRCGELRLGTGRPYGVLFVVGGLGPGQVRLGTVREYLTPDDPDPRRTRRLTSFFMSYDAESASGRGQRQVWIDRIAFRGSGASMGRTRRTATHEFHTVGVPLWLVTGMASVGPTLWLRRRRVDRHRGRTGACRHCGYDLTANASGTCPECGNPTATPAPQETARNPRARSAVRLVY